MQFNQPIVKNKSYKFRYRMTVNKHPPAKQVDAYLVSQFQFLLHRGGDAVTLTVDSSASGDIIEAKGMK